MVMVCSSMGIEAVISRAEGETFTVIGWSAVDCEGAQSLMTESSWAMTRGEMYFCVQDSTAILSWREVLSRHQSLVIEGSLRKQR